MTKTVSGVTTIEAQYGYDPYGIATKLQGSQDADFQYASYYMHAPSGLNLPVFRAYSSSLGRFINRDPKGEIGGINLYAYCYNKPISRIDPLGLSGYITIYTDWASHSASSNGNSALASSGDASGSGSGFGLGHSWIQFQKDASGDSPASNHTWGTWEKGNNPKFEEGGLGTDLELGESWSAGRRVWIDDGGESRLNDVIKQFQDMGPAAWQINQNCTNFSTSAFNAATGENLDPGFPLGTPKGLSDSILKQNGGMPWVVAPRPR